MATKRIETQLTIKAIDKYSSLIRGMQATTGRFADGVRSEVARLQGLRGPLKLIEDFKSAQSTFGKSEADLRKARQRVAELRAEMKKTSAPTRRMEEDFKRAQRAADRLRLAHEKNSNRLTDLRGKLKAAGVNSGDLAGEQRRLTDVVEQANGVLGKQVERLRRLEDMQSRIAAGRQHMERSLATAANVSFVGHASTQTGRRILTGLSRPVGAAVDFESAMADVRKVVEFDAPEEFEALRDDILRMSTIIPQSAQGLAQIVAAGGQSGLDLEELAEFAEAAAKIGVAFDISADRSGDAMAKIKTALGLTMEETVALFDAINHLSNNMASDAPSVLEFTNRVAVDGAVKGFSATDTMAFGSAMIAAGAQPDVAATSFRNMGKALVRGDGATDRQSAAFAQLNLKPIDVAKAMQEDAVATTMDVMARIRVLPEHLQASVTSDLFGDEARALAPLINNLALLESSLGLVANQQDYAGSAEAEYAARAATTANNLELTRNQVARLGISVGEVLLPPLNDFLKATQVVIDRVTAWSKENPKLTKGLVMTGLAVGGLAVAGGVLLTAAAGLIGTMAVLRFGLVGLGARAILAVSDLKKVGRAFSFLSKLPRFSLSRLITPIKWTSALIPKIGWKKLAGRLSLRTLVTPLRWGARLIPIIGWSALAGGLAWHLLIKPLGWDEYLPSIDWDRVWASFSWDGWLPSVDWSQFVSAITWPDWIPEIEWGKWLSVNWSDYLPEWNWSFIGSLDLGSLIQWPEPPAWLSWLMGNQPAPGSGAPLPPRMFAGGVRPAQQIVEGASEVHSVSLGAALPEKTASIGWPVIGAAGRSNLPRDVRVEINGGVKIETPPNVTDPELIAEHVAEKLGQRIGNVADAGFSD